MGVGAGLGAASIGGEATVGVVAQGLIGAAVPTAEAGLFGEDGLLDALAPVELLLAIEAGALGGTVVVVDELHGATVPVGIAPGVPICPAELPWPGSVFGMDWLGVVVVV